MRVYHREAEQVRRELQEWAGHQPPEIEAEDDKISFSNGTIIYVPFGLGVKVFQQILDANPPDEH